MIYDWVPSVAEEDDEDEADDAPAPPRERRRPPMEPTVIDPKYKLVMKGNKTYILYAGMLEAAMAGGLRSLTVRVLQLPAPENGHYAAVEATAIFEDGRTFVEVGDCSPTSCAALMAPAALRLAATRAKARCLRDALVISECSFEELGPGGDRNGHDGNGHDEGQREAERPVQPRQVNQENGNGHAEGVAACIECGLVMTPAQRKLSLHKYGACLCLAHQAGKKITTAIA